MTYGGYLVEAVVFSVAEVVMAELDYPLGHYNDNYTSQNEVQA
jgi:predicted DNA-binding protein with PD1-like motif